MFALCHGFALKPLPQSHLLNVLSSASGAIVEPVGLGVWLAEVGH